MIKSSPTLQPTLYEPTIYELSQVDPTGDANHYALYDHALDDVNAETTQATLHKPAEVIDLTGNIEQCAVCDNVLGEGDRDQSLMFVLEACLCVSNVWSQF